MHHHSFNALKDECEDSSEDNGEDNSEDNSEDNGEANSEDNGEDNGEGESNQACIKSHATKPSLQNHLFSKRNMFCNNCGKNGHVMHACKNPIISNGIIAFKRADEIASYLMIRRKDTLGFVEFIRGKYPIYNQMYVQRLIDEMTVDEKHRLQTQTFSELWKNVWGDYLNSKYQNEEAVSCERFNLLKSGIRLSRNGGSCYTLNTLIANSKTQWSEPEWGFPKGRRNYQEKDIDCALREFSEETGYDGTRLVVMQNVIPYEEIFMGSNMKTYKHKYYVACMPLPDQLPCEPPNFQKTEVSKMAWFTYDECMQHIRPYNLEKINILCNLNNALNECVMVYH